jgi:transcriptional regulator with XRE-family HTH domain
MANQQLGDRTNAADASDTDRSFPSDESNVVSRFQSLLDGDSLAAFSRRCGVPESGLRSYLKRGVKPGMDHLVAIADTAGVTVDWLATGRGPKLRRDLVAALKAAEQAPPGAEPPESLDLERLRTAVKAVEEGLNDAGLQRPADKKAEVFLYAYELIGQMGATEQARQLLARLVKLAR